MIDQPVGIVDVCVEASGRADLPVRELVAKFWARFSVEQKIDFESDRWREYLIKLWTKVEIQTAERKVFLGAVVPPL